MSSRDIGPALPPHMRRNHRSTSEDVGTSKDRSFYEERNEDEQSERRRRHREKYSERERKGDRDRDRDRDRARDKDRERERIKRDEYRDRERTSRNTSERDRIRHREKEEEEKSKFGRRGSKQDRKKEWTQSGSSKRSKRSKTDRTYNTDTEESSDDGCYATREWKGGNDSEHTDSEKEDKGMKSGTSMPMREERCSPVRPELINDELIGPALPSHLLKENTCVKTQEVGKNRCSVSHSSSESGSPECVKSVKTGSMSRKDLLPEPEQNIDVEIDQIGPALPSHLISSDHAQVKREDVSAGPAPALQKDDDGDELIGPALPPHLKKKSNQEENEENINTIGPVLPPHLKTKLQKADSIGPTLSTNSDVSEDDGPVATHSSFPEKRKECSVLGPSLPDGIDLEKYGAQLSYDSSDDEVVGPLLPEEMTRSGKNYMIQAQLEQNAAAIKRKLEEKDLPDSTATRREEWMLELPPEGTVDLGLGPRSFRARGAPEKGADRSMWTDTPSDKAKKEEEAKRRFELGITSTDEVKKQALTKELSSKDRSMEAVVKKHKRSKESLLEAHQKKLEKEKKKKEKAGVKVERRPFNRETDLKTNVFDDAQKKAIYKKAQILDTRFSSGESKYL